MNQNNDDVELLDSTPKQEVNSDNVNSNTSVSDVPSYSNDTSSFPNNFNVVESLDNTTSNPQPSVSSQDNASTNPNSSGVSESSSSSVDSSNSNGNSQSKSTLNPIVIVIIFVLLLATVFLLPYSEDFFQSLFSNNDSSYTGEITSGKLVCTLENEEDQVNYHYTETYDFENSGVLSLQHVVLIQGDADVLNARKAQCDQLQVVAGDFEGVSIECNLSSDEMVETQFFNFRNLDDTFSTAFIEAGGVYPNLEYGDDISEVQKNLELSGYDCEIS